MVSAERILTYCKVDQEADLESKPEDKPADSWPEKGNIEVLSVVSLLYICVRIQVGRSNIRVVLR